MNDKTFNMQMILSFTVALAIYFVSENLSETRAEFDSIFINRSQQMSSNFGARGIRDYVGKLKKLKDKFVNCKKSNAKVSSEVDIELPIINADNKVSHLSKFKNYGNKVKNVGRVINGKKIEKLSDAIGKIGNVIEDNTVKDQPFRNGTIKKFSDYNDLIFYIIFVGLLLTIIFYGKQWLEESEEYSNWAKDNGSFVSGVFLILSGLILMSTINIDSLKSDFISKNLNMNGTYYINPKSCNYKIFDNSKFTKLSRSRSIIVILLVAILIGVGITFNYIYMKNKTDEEKQEINTNICTGFIIFAFLVVCGLLFFGYSTEHVCCSTTLTNDKKYLCVMVFVSISALLGWSMK